MTHHVHDNFGTYMDPQLPPVPALALLSMFFLDLCALVVVFFLPVNLLGFYLPRGKTAFTGRTPLVM
jgi:hypothetical protein